LEVTSLGFIDHSSLDELFMKLNYNKIPINILRKLGETSLRCPYFIFCYRHKTWLTDTCDHKRRLHRGGGIFAPVLSKVPGQEYHLPRYYLGVIIALLTVYLLPY